MSPEIRIKRPTGIIKKSLRDVLVILVLVTLASLGYFQLPQGTTSTPDYQTEYTVLESSGELLLAATKLDAPTIEKVVVKSVTDGDTIKVTRQDGSVATIRYIGIDTPEIVHQGNSVNEPFGQAAKALNSWLINGKTVYLQSDAADTDKYGRLLRYVYLENGIMVNYAIIRMGYASIMTIPPNVAFQQQFFMGQEAAKKEGLHLFAPTY